MILDEEIREFDNSVNFLRSISRDDITLEFIRDKIIPGAGLGPIKEFLPPFLQDKCEMGLWAQQMPIQFAPYLMFLISKKVRSYLEIGSAHGGSFVLTYEILSKYYPVEASIISMTGESKYLRRYREKHGVDFKFYDLNSHSMEALKVIKSRMWDHIFLDGDHSRDGMVMDYSYASQSCRMLALHDVHNVACRGGMEAWAHIKKDASSKKHVEFISQYEEQWERKKDPGMGIGLIEL